MCDPLNGLAPKTKAPALQVYVRDTRYLPTTLTTNETYIVSF